MSSENILAIPIFILLSESVILSSSFPFSNSSIPDFW